MMPFTPSQTSGWQLHGTGAEDDSSALKPWNGLLSLTFEYSWASTNWCSGWITPRHAWSLNYPDVSTTWYRLFSCSQSQIPDLLDVQTSNADDNSEPFKPWNVQNFDRWLRGRWHSDHSRLAGRSVQCGTLILKAAERRIYSLVFILKPDFNAFSIRTSALRLIA